MTLKYAYKRLAYNPCLIELARLQQLSDDYNDPAEVQDNYNNSMKNYYRALTIVRKHSHSSVDKNNRVS